MGYKDLDKSPAYQLWLAANAWQRLLRRALDPLHLTHVQFVLLFSIDILAQQEEPVTQAKVSRFADMDENMTSQVLRSLAERGLIEREAHPNDGRARILKLTTGGSDLVCEGRRRIEPIREELFAEEGGQLAALLGAVVQRAGTIERK